MNPKLQKNVDMLVRRIGELVGNFDYREGPDLYFYRKLVSMRRSKNIDDLFDDAEDRYIETMYATLASWNMNSRGAKMKYFDDFKLDILQNRRSFVELSNYALDDLSVEDYRKVREIASEIYGNLSLMRTSGRLVSNSKTMHFILPDLVMPMDRENTLNFFYGNTSESPKKFMDIMDCVYQIAQKADLRRHLDKKWNQSITKVIDNAIISRMNPKYNIRKPFHDRKAAAPVGKIKS